MVVLSYKIYLYFTASYILWYFKILNAHKKKREMDYYNRWIPNAKLLLGEIHMKIINGLFHYINIRL